MNENILIGICGDSGVGKSRLSKLISSMFKLDTIIHECDRYHKWDRNSEKWKNLTHLNPDSNNLLTMKEDIFQLKLGKSINRNDYDHSSGNFTNELEIESRSVTIITGLHTLYDNFLSKMYDVSIFIEPQEDLRVLWKVKRDIVERNYSIDKIFDKINMRKNDSQLFISNQKNNADLIINYYTNDNLIINSLDKKIIYNKNLIDNNNILSCNPSIKMKLKINNDKFLDSLKIYFDIDSDKILDSSNITNDKIKSIKEDLIKRYNFLDIIENEYNKTENDEDYKETDLEEILQLILLVVSLSIL